MKVIGTSIQIPFPTAMKGCLNGPVGSSRGDNRGSVVEFTSARPSGSQMEFDNNRLPRCACNSETKDLELTVTVVICTRNRPYLLKNCLDAVARLEPSPDEVIVVDNSAGDRETEQIAREYCARYVIETKVGLSRARNRGLEEGKSAIIAYLDDDAVPDKRWLKCLLDPFADPGVATVTGSTISCDLGTTEIENEPHVRSISQIDSKWFEIAGFGGLGSGANMAFRKSACTGWRVFDERLGRGALLGGAEESHAFLLVLCRGYRAVYIPAAIVAHPLKGFDVELEATRSIAYWLLLFFEFPDHQLELVLFLLRRLRHKPLSWHRSSPDLGPMITSGWRVRLRAGLAGMRLYLRARKLKTCSPEEMLQ